MPTAVFDIEKGRICLREEFNNGLRYDFKLDGQ